MQYAKKYEFNSAVLKAVESCAAGGRKADSVMEECFPTDCGFSRSAAEAVLLQWLRNRMLIDAAVFSLCKKNPKKNALNVLRAAAADAMSSEGTKFAQVVHNWVGFSKTKMSGNESGFVNAVLRKLPDAVEKLRRSSGSAESLAIKYSHPQWLVEKWTKQFGAEKTLEILECSQTPSEVFFRVSPFPQASKLFSDYAVCFSKTEFENFFKLKGGFWSRAKELLKSRFFYVQDPSTYFAPLQFSPMPGSYLDLCAAPGGKSRAIADLILKNGSAEKSKNSLLVGVDLPERAGQLAENFSKIDFMKAEVAECDILDGESLSETLSSKNLPLEYDGVFVDAPCSNTGVLRRRPDARYRISENDIAACAKKQLEILETAKKFVKPGGKLEYSTCSIENEENSEVVHKFLLKNKNFSLISENILLPKYENDGAGYALIQRDV